MKNTFLACAICLAVGLLIGLLLHIPGCKGGGGTDLSKLQLIHRDTITQKISIHDTLRFTIGHQAPVKIYGKDTIYFRENGSGQQTIIAFDTAAYDTTIHGNNFTARLKDTVSDSRIIGRSLDFIAAIPTTVTTITKTVVKPSPIVRVAVGAGVSGPALDIAPAALLSFKDWAYVSGNYGLLHGSFNITFYSRISFKKQNNP